MQFLFSPHCFRSVFIAPAAFPICLPSLLICIVFLAVFEFLLFIYNEGKCIQFFFTILILLQFQQQLHSMYLLILEQFVTIPMLLMKPFHCTAFLVQVLCLFSIKCIPTFLKNRYWEWVFQCPFCICFAGGEENLLIAVYLYYDQVLYHIFLLNSGCYRYNHHQIGIV